VEGVSLKKTFRQTDLSASAFAGGRDNQGLRWKLSAG